MNEKIENFRNMFLNNPNKENEIKLIKALKITQFLAPIIINQPLSKLDGSAIFEEEGSNIKFITLVDDEKKLSFFPAFSSLEEMMKWRKDNEQETIQMQLKDYIALAENSQNSYAGVVINAFSCNLTLSFNVIKRFYDQ